MDFQRYLRTKVSVDARAFNQPVWNTLLAQLRELGPDPLRVLEVGGGIGSMAARILDAGLPQRIAYTLVDQDAESVAAAREALPKITCITADAFDFIEQHPDEGWDLLVAHAFLDLVDLPTGLPRLLAALQPAGAVYFPINFDGQSTFEPAVDTEFEASLLAGYHRSMDQRLVNGQPSGDSRTGSHLAPALEAAGVRVLASGDSDWVVRAEGGAYPADEAYFLNCILTTIEQEMRGRGGINAGKLDAWLAARRAQILAGSLVYIAHQLDYCGVLAD